MILPKCLDGMAGRVGTRPDAADWLRLDPLGASITDAAQAMGVSRKTLSKIINGRGRVTPEIALRLSVALGSSAESWLGHQAAYAPDSVTSTPV